MSTDAEVAIVGAGPIGLECAVAFRRLGVPVVHLEGGAIGETVRWFPRQMRFFSSPERIAIAGVPFVTVDQEKATREEYLAYLRSVVELFDLEVRTFERVVDIERGDDGGFALHTRCATGPAVVHARRVVLAIGDMHRPRLLGIPGEDLPHVQHYFDEPHPYFRRRLLVVGGKNSAVEAALRCHRTGARVTVSCRRRHFPEGSVKRWLLPDIENQIAHGAIRFLPRTVPVEISPSEVTLEDLSTGELVHVASDAVLLLTGYEMDAELLERAGVTLEGDARAPRLDAETQETDVPGLHVAGTAAAGTQQGFRLFIENCHPHVDRIVRAVTGRGAPFPTGDATGAARDLPES